MNSTRKSYIMAVLIAVLVLYSHANTKPPPADLGYEPPDGWEFVMKLDTLSGLFLHCHNDTCFIVASFAGSREIPFFHRLSTNGGDTWEDLKEIYPLNFKMNSNALHRFTADMDEMQRYYEVSYDFYKTSERYKAVNLFLDDKDLLESPIDTNTLISVHEGKQSTHMGYIFHNTAAQISRNAGRNWEILDLYRYPLGYTVYTFNFDWSEKGHWFYKSSDGYDDMDYQSQPDRYFETFDNGRTFREIKFDPSSQSNINYLFGIDGKKQLRKEVRSNASGITIYTYDDAISQGTFIDWLYLIDPRKPKTNIDSGYKRAFSFIEGYNQYDNSNFNNIFLPVYEHIGDILNNDYKLIRYIYESQDNGKTWNLINYIGQNPYFKSSVLDQGTKTVWIHVKDEPYQVGKHHAYYKGSLWKLKLPWGASSVENLKTEDGFSVYPNPARDYITITKTSEGSEIKIFNMLGRECKSPHPDPLRRRGSNN